MAQQPGGKNGSQEARERGGRRCPSVLHDDKGATVVGGPELSNLCGRMAGSLDMFQRYVVFVGEMGFFSYLSCATEGTRGRVRKRVGAEGLSVLRPGRWCF